MGFERFPAHTKKKKNVVHSFNDITLVLFLRYMFSLKFSCSHNIILGQRRKSNTPRFRVVRVIFVAVVVKSNIQRYNTARGIKTPFVKIMINQIELFTNVFRAMLQPQRATAFARAVDFCFFFCIFSEN